MRVTMQVCISADALETIAGIEQRVRDRVGPIRISTSRLVEAIIIAASLTSFPKESEWSPQDEGRYTTVSVDQRIPSAWVALLQNTYNGRRFLLSFLLRQPDVVSRAEEILATPNSLDDHLSSIAGPSATVPKPRSIKISVRLTDDLWSRLDSTVKQDKMSISEFVSRAVAARLSDSAS